MDVTALFHKIRTCDKRGKFTYSDQEVLSDIREAIAAEREEAVAQERRRCLGHAQAYRDPANIAIAIKEELARMGRDDLENYAIRLADGVQSIQEKVDRLQKIVDRIMPLN